MLTSQPVSRQTSFPDSLSDADKLCCVLPYARYESEVRPITRKATSLLRYLRDVSDYNANLHTIMAAVSM